MGYLNKNSAPLVISKDKTTVVVCKNGNPDEALMNLCRSAEKKFKNIVIVNVNKPYSVLVEKFKEQKINYSNFHFIDCISASFMKQASSEHSVYISSPRALTELAIALTNLSPKTDLVILDSFSGLTLYNNPSMVLRFLNSLSVKFRKNGLTAIYLITGATGPELINDLSLFADEIKEF